MQSYSKEFRRDVLAACDSGIGTQSVALQFGVSESWVRRINQQRRETGQIAAKTTRNRTPTWQAWADWLKDTVAAQPDLYRREIKAKLKEELGIDTSEGLIGRACRSLNLTRKKKTLIAAEQEREDVVQSRQEWVAAQVTLAPDQVVFLDETWAKTNMTRTHGRCARGERLIEKVPCGRWQTTTFLGAMRSTGFIAPLCVDGAINGAVFKAWVEQHLVRELRVGDVVVMDNLSSHKVAGVAEAVESVGARVLYLPPYSPDLNPIELAFSKFKKLLRDGAERTVDKLWDLCGRILELFTETECRNYLKHCGYRYT
jgi:transposase